MQPQSRRSMIALIVMVAMIPIVFAIGTSVKATSEQWSAIGAVGQWASAILPLIAIVFAYQQTKAANEQVVVTREALDDSRKSAEEARLEASAPYLAIRLSGYTGGPGAYGHLEFDVHNLGNGPALAVSAVYTNLQSGEPRPLGMVAVLGVSDHYTVRIERPTPLPGRLTMTYYSRHGRKYPETYEFTENEQGPIVSMYMQGELVAISRK